MTTTLDAPKTTTTTRTETCLFCKGTGRCEKCCGEGSYQVRVGWLAFKRTVRCRACRGAGECGLCRGKGVESCAEPGGPVE